jgi:hypothetical protein
LLAARSGLVFGTVYISIPGGCMSGTVEKAQGKSDIRKENREFCMMWGCRCLTVDYSCTSCPVLTDLQVMADEFHIKFQMAEPLLDSTDA